PRRELGTSAPSRLFNVRKGAQIVSRTARWLLGACTAIAALAVGVPAALANDPVVPVVHVTVNVTAAQQAAVDQSNAHAQSGNANANGGVATGGNGIGHGGSAGNGVVNTSGNAANSTDSCSGGCTASGGSGGDVGATSSGDASGDTNANGGDTGANS